MALLTTLLYFVITIFVLVTIHEFGHFITARIFGMHVPVFSVGMGRRLFGFNKLNGFTVGPLPEDVEVKLGENTDYRLALLPIGGYAKIDGMIDETQTEALATEPQPWEFRVKPWWQKAIVISGGIIMNLLLAIVFFTGIMYFGGREVRNTTTVGYVSPNSVSAKLGIVPGDKITAINGKPVTNWDQVEDKVGIDNLFRDFTVSLERNGQPFTITYKNSDMGNPTDEHRLVTKWGLLPIGTGSAKVNGVVAASPAERAGLKKGDKITMVAGNPTYTDRALVDNISAHPNQEIDIEWQRDNQNMRSKVTPDAAGKIGIEIITEPYTGPVIKEQYSLGESFSLGISELSTNVRLFVKTIALSVTGKMDVKKAIGGPIKIAQIAGQSAAGGAWNFIKFMALLSVSLALLNLLPIPALDGGHLVIIFIEAILGHELSQRFKVNFQKVGAAFLILLMVFAVFNDIRGL